MSKHIFGLFLSKSDMLNQNKGVIFAKVIFDDTSELSENQKIRTIKIFGQSKNSDNQKFRSIKVSGQSRIKNNGQVSDNQKLRTIKIFVQSIISNKWVNDYETVLENS